MNPIRVFSMQAGTGSTFSAGGRGGVPNLTKSLAAVACGGLDRRSYSVARVKWARDQGSAQTLENLLMGAAVDLAHRENWGIKEDRLRMLCKLNTLELLYPRVFNTARIRSQCLGCHESSMGTNKPLGRQYRAIGAITDEWESTALRHVRKKMRG